MKALFTLPAVLLIMNIGMAQEITQKLEPFDKIVVSPKIDLVLIPGNDESIRITYSGVDEDRIMIDQSRGRVHVYLEDAKIYDKGVKRSRHMFDRRPRYRFAQLTAYVTFRSLRHIEIRGDGEVLCEGHIDAKKIKLKAYGDNDIRIASLEAKTVKARFYGDNTMKIKEGEAGHINYKLFGDNKIDTRGVRTVTSSTTIYGDGRVLMHVTGEVHVSSFGDPTVYVIGSPVISKGIILGEADIRRN
jgi:hypothetical protein